ncbi:MAG: DMT family transporter [Pseudopedobacter sp.]|nr:DMT family transporter [Deinococcales bacterium]
MSWIFYLLAALGGSFLTLQAGINGQLRELLGTPFRASFVSFLIGTLPLFFLALGTRAPLPTLKALSSAPWWVWTGGLLGIFFVTFSILLPPRLGVAVYFALVVAGQLLMALVLDHFGALGFERHPMSAMRLLGAALLIAGVVIIRKF